VENLAHLEHRLRVAGDRVCIVDLYNRACGACKEVEKHFAASCRVSGLEDDGPVFLKHNIRDDRDDLSDVARLYGVRHAPAFLVFQGGALKWRMRGRDLARVARAARELEEEARAGGRSN